jgi:hypothetical protein
MSFDYKAFFTAAAGEVAAPLASIGDEAHLRGNKTTRAIGNVSGMALHDFSGASLTVGEAQANRWLVLGLLSKRDMTSADTELATRESYDLGRLADRARDLAVAAVFVDPDDKYDRSALPQTSGSLMAWKTRDAALPPPLEDLHAKIPTVWIVDPKGEVKREFDTGASAEVIFGALVVLQHGHTLGVPKPVPLPGDEPARFSAGGLSIAAAFLGFLGALYWPMALLMTIYGEPLRALRYHEGLKSIGAAAGDYAIVQGISAGSLAVFLLGRAIAANVSQAPEVKAFASWWLGVAGLLAISSATGRFYVHNASRFAWVKAKARETPAAGLAIGIPANMNAPVPASGEAKK